MCAWKVCKSDAYLDCSADLAAPSYPIQGRIKLTI